MDDKNPAVAAQTRIPPAMLEAVAKDPKTLTELARKLLLKRIDRMETVLGKPDTPFSHHLQHAEFLSKIGDVVPKASAGGASGPGFYVNFVVKKPDDLPKVSGVEVVQALKAPGDCIGQHVTTDEDG